jgi:hypothetical protein
VPPDGATTEGMQTTPERAPTDVQEPAPAAERAPDAAPAVDAGNAGAAGAPASRTAARRPKVPQPPRRTGSRDATRSYSYQRPAPIQDVPSSGIETPSTRTSIGPCAGGVAALGLCSGRVAVDGR